MATRLVTAEDKQKYPELNSKGVSVNQYFDFSLLEAQEQPVKKTFFQERKSIPIDQTPVIEEIKNPVTERNEPTPVVGNESDNDAKKSEPKKDAIKKPINKTPVTKKVVKRK